MLLNESLKDESLSLSSNRNTDEWQQIRLLQGQGKALQI